MWEDVKLIIGIRKQIEIMVIDLLDSNFQRKSIRPNSWTAKWKSTQIIEDMGRVRRKEIFSKLNFSL